MWQIREEQRQKQAEAEARKKKRQEAKKRREQNRDARGEEKLGMAVTANGTEGLKKGSQVRFTNPFAFRYE